MKLSTYLSSSKMTYAEFAEAIGASTFAVGKWARGERLPRPDTLSKIVAATQGQVTPNDFFASSSVLNVEAA